MDTEGLYPEFLRSEGICTDTRKEVRGRIFFALSGENFDGNRFVGKALEGGCRLAVCEYFEQGEPEVEARVIRVPCALEALQALATRHRRELGRSGRGQQGVVQPGLQILAITGSNGKTTTKELIKRVLEMKFRTLATEGNYNNHLGVPLTLLRLKDEEIAVIEMGANHPGEIAALARIAEPGTGLITNVGKAHLEGFGSLQGVLSAKGELYEYLSASGGVAIVDGDDEMLLGKARSTGVPFFSVGPAGPDGANGPAGPAGSAGVLPVWVKLLAQEPYLEVELGVGDEHFRVQTSLVGAYNLQNMKLAAACGLHYGVSGKDIARALASYVPSNQRSQLVEGRSNRVVFDSYNANPSSMREAVMSLSAYGGDRTMIILGDMAEMGEAAEQEHRDLATWLEDREAERVVLVGSLFSSLLEPSGNRIVFEKVEDLEAWLRKDKPEGYTILVKGSRSMQLERLSPLLTAL